MNYSVYTGTAKGQNVPITLSVVATGLSRHQANDMARDMRAKRESNATLIGVWDGSKFKSLY